MAILWYMNAGLSKKAGSRSKRSRHRRRRSPRRMKKRFQSCPGCQRRLQGHGLLLGSSKLLVCENCGARLGAKFSWPCAVVLACVFVVLMTESLARGQGGSYHFILLIVFGMISPLVQAYCTHIYISRRHR